MSRFLRAFYRIFIKNRFIRWVWLLALSLWGIKWVTDNAITKKKPLFSKTVLAIPSADIHTFTIRSASDEEMTFTRHDDRSWLAVKNDVTIQVPEDSIAVFLNLFNKMDSYAVKKISESEENPAYLYKVFINRKNNLNDSLTVFYMAFDSLSKENLTFLKVSQEPFLQGIKGDILGLLKKDFNDFRSTELMPVLLRKDISKVIFRTPFDTVSFYAKDTLHWTFSNERFSVVSDTFNRYLKNLELLRGGTFYDAARDFVENKNIENQMVILHSTDSVVLTAYRRERLLILHSTANKDTYFKTDSVNHIFKPLKDFIRPKF